MLIGLLRIGVDSQAQTPNRSPFIFPAMTEVEELETEDVELKTAESLVGPANP